MTEENRCHCLDIVQVTVKLTNFLIFCMAGKLMA